VLFDAAGRVTRDGHPGVGSAVSLCIRLQDGGVYRSVVGSNHLRFTFLVDGQVYLGDSLPVRVRRIHTVSDQPLFTQPYLGSRHGEHGAFCCFADDSEKVHDRSGATGPVLTSQRFIT
jgi:hypothetical protein